MKTTVDGLTKALMNELENYAGAVTENADEAVNITAKEAVKELKNANPSGSGKYGSWHDYNKSWTIKYNTVDKRYHRGATIHNKSYYQLTHLLEKGHALAQGGRAKAYPHIAPVAEKADLELYKRIVQGI